MSKYAIIFDMNTFTENPPIEENYLFIDICNLIDLSDVDTVLICNFDAGNHPTMTELLNYNFKDKRVVEADYIEEDELDKVTEITYYGIGLNNMLNHSCISVYPMKKAGKICQAYNVGLKEFDRLNVNELEPVHEHTIPGRPEIMLYTF